MPLAVVCTCPVTLLDCVKGVWFPAVWVFQEELHSWRYCCQATTEAEFLYCPPVRLRALWSCWANRETFSEGGIYYKFALLSFLGCVNECIRTKSQTFTCVFKLRTLIKSRCFHWSPFGQKTPNCTSKVGHVAFGASGIELQAPYVISAHIWTAIIKICGILFVESFVALGFKLQTAKGVNGESHCKS